MHGFKTKMGMINAPFKTFPNVNANDDEMLRASYTLHSQKTRINWRGRRRWRQRDREKNREEKKIDRTECKTMRLSLIRSRGQRNDNIANMQRLTASSNLFLSSSFVLIYFLFFFIMLMLNGIIFMGLIRFFLLVRISGLSSSQLTECTNLPREVKTHIYTYEIRSRRDRDNEIETMTMSMIIE